MALQAFNTEISNIFTESDEALEMLLFENITEDLMEAYKGGKKLTRKESKPKCTKLGNETETFKGWNITSTKIFNKLGRGVKFNRLYSESKEMEVELKLIYTKLSGKLYRDVKGVNGNEEDSDISSNDDIHGYDGFAGEEMES